MTENKENINIDKIVKHWIETSDEDFKTMLTLFDAKSYGWSLFLGHISTEKLLKGLYVKKISKTCAVYAQLIQISRTNRAGFN
ncbi:MAG: HEPN domain-containing protein [Bacteroidales bacterium]